MAGWKNITIAGQHVCIFHVEICVLCYWHSVKYKLRLEKSTQLSMYQQPICPFHLEVITTSSSLQLVNCLSAPIKRKTLSNAMICNYIVRKLRVAMKNSWLLCDFLLSALNYVTWFFSITCMNFSHHFRMSFSRWPIRSGQNDCKQCSGDNPKVKTSTTLSFSWISECSTLFKLHISMTRSE